MAGVQTFNFFYARTILMQKTVSYLNSVHFYVLYAVVVSLQYPPGKFLNPIFVRGFPSAAQLILC